MSIKSNEKEEKNPNQATASHESVSEWHDNLQNQFPEECRNVTISITLSQRDYVKAEWGYKFGNYTYEDDSAFGEYMRCIEKFAFDEELGKKEITLSYIADVCIGNYIIEFRDNPISCEEFNKRNWLYNEAGYKVIWIFDFISEFEIKNMDYTDETGRRNYGAYYVWKFPVNTFKNYCPQDYEDVILLFQISEPSNNDYSSAENGYLEKIIWTPYNPDNDTASFEEFLTSYYPGNLVELKECIEESSL